MKLQKLQCFLVVRFFLATIWKQLGDVPVTWLVNVGLPSGLHGNCVRPVFSAGQALALEAVMAGVQLGKVTITYQMTKLSYLCLVTNVFLTSFYRHKYTSDQKMYAYSDTTFWQSILYPFLSRSVNCQPQIPLCDSVVMQILQQPVRSFHLIDF